MESEWWKIDFPDYDPQYDDPEYDSHEMSEEEWEEREAIAEQAKEKFGPKQTQKIDELKG
jgi:hypothetical protein